MNHSVNEIHLLLSNKGFNLVGAILSLVFIASSMTSLILYFFRKDLFRRFGEIAYAARVMSIVPVMFWTAGKNISSNLLFGGQSAVDLVTGNIIGGLGFGYILVRRWVKTNPAQSSDGLGTPEVSSQDNNVIPAQLLLTFGFLVFIGSVWWVSNNFYDYASDGITHLLAQSVGGLLVTLIIGFFINGRRITQRLWGVCFTLVALGFMGNHFHPTLEAIEIRDGKKILSGGKNPQELLQLAEMNKENKYVRMMFEALKGRFDNERKLEIFLSPLSVSETDCVEKIYSGDQITYRTCAKIYTDKLILQRSALASLPNYLAEIDNEGLRIAQRVLTEIHWVNGRIALEFGEGVKESSAKRRIFVYRIVNSLINYTEALEELFAFSADNQSKMLVADGRLQFYDDAAVSAYNVIFNRVLAAEETYNKAFTEAVEYDNSRIQKIGNEQ